MKKIYLLAVMLLCSIVAFAQVKKVAILEIVDKEGSISYSQKLMLRSSLAKAVTNTPGYEAYDRTDMDAIMGEQDFQRTGMVSDDQIKRLGEMTGAAYILVAEAVKTDESSLFVTAKILDVETARTEQTDYTTMGIGSKTILQGCEELASKLLKTKETPKVSSTVHKKEEVVEPTYESIKPAMIRTGNEYSYNGQYLTKREYENLLRNTCPDAYSQYKKGNTLVKTGWGLFGAGAAMVVGGCVMIITAEGMPSYEEYEHRNGSTYHVELTPEQQRANKLCNAVFGSGVAFLSIGSVALTTSIPLLCVGYTKRDKRALETFNRQCAEPAVTYNLTAGQNGIGLAINF